MALQINENQGLFEITGNITAQNIGVLKVYFDSIFESHDVVVLSLEKVTEMDATAALFFEKLYREVATNKKVLSIVGKQNMDIAEIMSLTRTDYILSSDRV